MLAARVAPRVFRTGSKPHSSFPCVQLLPSHPPCALGHSRLSNRATKQEEGRGTLIKVISTVALAGALAACTVGRPANPTVGGTEGGSSGALIGGLVTIPIGCAPGACSARLSNLWRHRPRRRSYAVLAASGCCGLLTGIALPPLAQSVAGRPRPRGMRRGSRLASPEAIAPEPALHTAPPASSRSTSGRARSTRPSKRERRIVSRNA